MSVDHEVSVALAAQHLWGFVDALRSAGLTTSPPKHADYFAAIAESAPKDISMLYWYSRLTLLTEIADLDIFDRTFDDWFRENHDGYNATSNDETDDSETPTPQEPGETELPLQNETLQGDGIEASTLTVVSHRQFGTTETQRRAAMSELRRCWRANLPTTQSRRHRPSRAGRKLDMRGTLREARRSGGEILDLRWSARPPKRRRLLMMIDVSGSLREHSPDLMRLAHTAVHSSDAATEVFTFGTKLTRVTAALGHTDVDDALRALATTVDDADGGTAIGAALAEFLDNSRYLALARGAVIVVVSDGLERGDCTAMVQSTRRLSYLAHRLIWWSPLATAPDYRPETKGMREQLRYLDHLGGVHDLVSAIPEIATIPSIVAGSRRSAQRNWDTRLSPES